MGNARPYPPRPPATATWRSRQHTAGREKNTGRGNNNTAAIGSGWPSKGSVVHGEAAVDRRKAVPGRQCRRGSGRLTGRSCRLASRPSSAARRRTKGPAGCGRSCVGPKPQTWDSSYSGRSQRLMSRIGAVGRAPLVARPEPPADRELLDCVWNGSLFQDGTTWRTRQGTVLKKKKKKKEVDDEDDDEDKDEDEDECEDETEDETEDDDEDEETNTTQKKTARRRHHGRATAGPTC